MNKFNRLKNIFYHLNDEKERVLTFNKIISSFDSNDDNHIDFLIDNRDLLSLIKKYFVGTQKQISNNNKSVKKAKDYLKDYDHIKDKIFFYKKSLDSCETDDQIKVILTEILDNTGECYLHIIFQKLSLSKYKRLMTEIAMES